LTLNTSARERRVFFLRLRGDWSFILKHSAALSYAVYRKIRNRARIAASSQHRGRKLWPQWIGARSAIDGLPPVSGSALRFPHYPALVSPSLGRAARAMPAAMEHGDDPENRFAQHRWGFLLQAQFQGSVDWNSNVNECLAWISARSDKSQPAWEPYSVCERVANLLVFLAAMPSALRESQLRPELLQFLDSSTAWIYRHLEYYGPSETNNHIIENARALVMVGSVTNNTTAMTAGMRTFRWCLPKLIMSEGFLRERSSHYQLITMNWLLDAWHFVAARAGEDSADAQFLRGYATQMLEAAGMLCDARGLLLALVGDVSPDITPEQSSARLALLYPGYWPRPALVRDPVEFRDGWFRLGAQADVVLGNLPRGHYPPRFPTHGHCDATSFVWRHGAIEVLVDPGRYRYTAAPVAMYQISASGHNVPTVNGLAPVCESLIANGQWWPRPYADATLEAYERDGGIVLAHDGFARATPVGRHFRRILLGDATLLVQDSFEGLGQVELAWCWHFGSCFQDFDQDNLVAAGPGVSVKLSVLGVAGTARVAPLHGGTPGSWTSRVYGQKQPALGIGLHWSVALPATVSTKFEFQVSA
jgi:Heparinase II/III-like protein